MRSWIARRTLRAISQRYGYDTTYIETMLNESPSAFFKFTPLDESVPSPRSARWRATPLVAAKAEDCGPAPNSPSDMALEAGMSKGQIDAVLRRNPSAMNSDTLAFRFADAVVRRSVRERRQMPRSRSRPMGRERHHRPASRCEMRPDVPDDQKPGYARKCSQVNVDGTKIDVIKQAA